MAKYKISNVTHILLGDQKTTLFQVYALNYTGWVYVGTYGILGHFKKPKTIIRKHCEVENKPFIPSEWGLE